MHGRASAWRLCGEGLWSWRLDEAARGASKEGISRGSTRGVVAGFLALASWWFSDDDSDRPTQQDDAMPRRQCGLPVVRRRGGRRRDATGSSQRLGYSTLACGVVGISLVGSTARSRGRGRVWEGTGRRSGSGA
jgi:hypothetical protein